MNKMFSIIIPVYNAENNIKRLLSAIRKTLYYPVTEVICVDDGSSDTSYSILEEETIHDSNLKIYHQENKGVSTARNEGLLLASGKYVFFIDSDDMINVIAYDAMTRKLIKDEPDMAIFGIQDIFYTKKGKTKTVKNYVEEEHYDAIQFCSKLGILLNKDIMYSPCNKVYKNEILKQHNITYQEAYAINEDIIFNIDYLHHADSIMMYSDYVYNYVHDAALQSSSMRYHDNVKDILMDVYERISNLLKEKGGYEENQVELHKFLLRKVSYSLNNVFSKTSTLTDEEKLKFISNLYQDEQIKEALQDKNVKMKEADQKLLLALHQHQQEKVIYQLYKMRNRLR